MTNDALDTLLPCPFCEAKIIFIERKFLKMDCPDAEMEEQAKAVCNSCGISTQFCYETNCFSAEQNARTAWNTRPRLSGNTVKALNALYRLSEAAKFLAREKDLQDIRDDVALIDAALTQPKEDVDLDSLKREVKKYLDSKVDGYWWDDIITYLHDKGYLAARGFGVPEGYALVPIEPTGEMPWVGKDILNVLTGSNYSCFVAESVYKAMIKAAPKIDFDGLKKDTSNTQELLGNCEDFTVGCNTGWNDCLDHIAAKYPHLRKV